MKCHHCHCGLKHQLKKFRAKKLGFIGIALMGLHILFHVAECLVLPAILVAFNHASDDATAITTEIETADPEIANSTTSDDDSLTFSFDAMLLENLYPHE